MFVAGGTVPASMAAGVTALMGGVEIEFSLLCEVNRHEHTGKQSVKRQGGAEGKFSPR